MGQYMPAVVLPHWGVAVVKGIEGAVADTVDLWKEMVVGVHLMAVLKVLLDLLVACNLLMLVVLQLVQLDMMALAVAEQR